MKHLMRIEWAGAMSETNEWYKHTSVWYGPITTGKITSAALGVISHAAKSGNVQIKDKNIIAHIRLLEVCPNDLVAVVIDELTLNMEQTGADSELGLKGPYIPGTINY